MRTVNVRIEAQVDGGAQPVVNRLWSRWMPSQEEPISVVGIGVEGDALTMQSTFTARGASLEGCEMLVLAEIDKMGLRCVSINGRPVGGVA